MNTLNYNRLTIKRYIFIIFILLIIFINGKPILANYSTAVPYNSYVYNFWDEPVSSPQAYIPSKQIKGVDLEIGQIENPRDMFVHEESSQIHILDSGNNRIVIVDENFELVNIIESFENNGSSDSLNEPRGIFVTSEGNIYIADTENRRIVELDKSGSFIREIKNPAETADSLSDDFVFRPNKIAVDPAGRINVIVANVYQGIMQFDGDGTFTGFFGSPQVTPSPADLFWRNIATDEQRRGLRLFIPTEFTNVHIGDDGFLLATIGYREEDDEAIRKLNPAGINVLRETGFQEPLGDHFSDDEISSSMFVDITDQDNGIYSVLDRRRGRIFTYDDNSRLLYIFGGRGERKGLFTNPVAIEYRGKDILVLDNETGYINVFEPTRYAEYVIQAIEYYNDGRYQQSKNMWAEVLELNSNLDLAYTGLGRIYFMENEHQTAMELFESGNDRENYSGAFRFYREKIIAKNFSNIIYGILILILILFLYKTIRRKYSSLFVQAAHITKAEKRLQNRSINKVYKYIIKYTKQISYSLYVIFHPFDGFVNLKFEKKGSYFSASILLFITSLTYILLQVYTGFIFNTRNLREFSFLLEFSSVVVPFLLWCVINWSVTTLMDGKGSIREIYITTAYALTPIILINIPTTIISNYLLLDEGAFYYFFIAFSVFWSMCLLFFGMMTIHEYDLSKNILATIIVLVGMGGFLFIALLFFEIIERLTSFISDIYNELMLRR